MSRRPKKRTKKYSGEDAKRVQPASEPVVHRYEAIERGAFGQWWFERKKLIRTIAIVVGVIVLVCWLVAEIISLIF